MDLNIGMKRGKLVELHKALGDALEEKPEDTPAGGIQVEIYGAGGSGADYVDVLTIGSEDMGTDRTDLADGVILAEVG